MLIHLLFSFRFRTSSSYFIFLSSFSFPLCTFTLSLSIFLSFSYPVPLLALTFYSLYLTISFLHTFACPIRPPHFADSILCSLSCIFSSWICSQFFFFFWSSVAFIFFPSSFICNAKQTVCFRDSYFCKWTRSKPVALLKCRRKKV